MKKIFPILFALAVVLTASNCKKSTTVTPVTPVTPAVFEMNFKTMYGAKPMLIEKVYDYNGKKIRFIRTQFFMAYDTGLFDSPVGNDLPKTTLVKFTNAIDTSGVTIELPLANKTWSSVNFSIGVPKTINAKLPKDYFFPDGLADSGNFWDSWQSYIFTKLDGEIDKDGDGIYETVFTLHTGGDDLVTPMKFAKSFVVENNKTTRINFELNINELIKNIDLLTVNSTHQVGAAPIMKIIMGNYPTALTVK